MKKIITILSTVLMALAAWSCGNVSGDGASDNAPDSVSPVKSDLIIPCRGGEG